MQTRFELTTGLRRQQKKKVGSASAGLGNEWQQAARPIHPQGKRRPAARLPPAARVWAVRIYQMACRRMQLLYCVPAAYVHATFKYHARDWMICQNRRRKQAQVWGMRDPDAVVSSRYIVHIGYTYNLICLYL